MSLLKNRLSLNSVASSDTDSFSSFPQEDWGSDFQDADEYQYADDYEEESSFAQDDEYYDDDYTEDSFSDEPDDSYQDDSFFDEDSLFADDEEDDSFKEESLPKNTSGSLRSRMTSHSSTNSESEDWFSNASKKTEVKQRKNAFEEMMKQSEHATSAIALEDQEKSLDFKDAFGFTEEEMEVVALREQWEKEQNKKQHVLLTRVINIFLILGCIYMIFLIFGVSVTTFQYSENGKVEPQIMTAKDIALKKEFDVIRVEYERCQIIYQKLLILTYRLHNAKDEDIQKIAAEFAPLATEIQNTHKKEQGLKVQNEQKLFIEMTLHFLDTSQQYCNYTASGYTQNKKEDIESSNALWNGGVNNQTGEPIVTIGDQFIILHQNILSLGEGLKGVDMIEIKQWSPDKYLNKVIDSK